MKNGGNEKKVILTYLQPVQARYGIDPITKKKAYKTFTGCTSKVDKAIKKFLDGGSVRHDATIYRRSLISTKDVTGATESCLSPVFGGFSHYF